MLFLQALQMQRAQKRTSFTPQMRSQSYILDNCHRQGELHMLESSGNSKLSDDMGRQAVDPCAREEDPSRRGRQYTSDEIEGRALACSVWTDESNDFAFSYLKVERVHGDQPAKRFAQL